MKLNWGTGIALVYGAFAVIMVAVVIRSRHYDPGLVSKDYYNLDMNYQERMNKKQNTANLPDGLQVQYDAVRQMINLQFPAVAGKPAGFVKCFRSASVKDDLQLNVQTGPNGLMEIPAAQMTSGLWHLEVEWEANGTKYFNEATITVTHA